MRGARLTIALLALLAGFTVAPQALACKCADDSGFEEEVEHAQIAFEGRVVRRWPTLLSGEIEGVGRYLALSESYEFEVTKPLRGDLARAPRLVQTGFCGAVFSEGTLYRVAAIRSQYWGGQFGTGPCSASGPIVGLPTPETTSSWRRGARYVTAVVLGSVASTVNQLRSESWNPWEEKRDRWRTIAAIAYSSLWLSVVLLAIRTGRKGLTWKRGTALFLIAAGIGSLALVLARSDWAFALVTR